MVGIFEENYCCYGYRRLHSMHLITNLFISARVVSRLMAEDQLMVEAGAACNR